MVANPVSEALEELERQLPLFGDTRVVGGNGMGPSNRAWLTLGEAARIIREAVKDKSYRATPLGQLVGRYLRWFRNEYGATPSTLRDYEAEEVIYIDHNHLHMVGNVDTGCDAKF